MTGQHLMPVRPEPDLAVIAHDLNQHVESAERHASKAVEAAVKAGGLLREAKEIVPHGEWEKWITDNTTLAPRTAQAYMRLAKQVTELPQEEAQRVAELPLREAMRAISTPAEAPPRSSPVFDTRRTAREQNLHRYKQIMLKLGRPLARRLHNGIFRRGEIDGYRRQVQALLDLLNEIETDARELGGADGFIGADKEVTE